MITACTGLSWPLGPQDRHLWDFVTLPAYRGRGVYPHLLQAILRAESEGAEHLGKCVLLRPKQRLNQRRNGLEL